MFSPQRSYLDRDNYCEYYLKASLENKSGPGGHKKTSSILVD